MSKIVVIEKIEGNTLVGKIKNETIEIKINDDDKQIIEQELKKGNNVISIDDDKKEELAGIAEYNPLAYVETPLQALKIANTIISNFEGDDRDNAFFKNSATNMLAALIIYVNAEYPPNQANVAQVINVYTKYVQDEETFAEWLPTVTDDHPAREMLNAILDLTGNTRGCVTSTLNNGFSISQ